MNIASYYEKRDVLTLTGLAWSDLVALESSGQFPVRMSPSRLLWRKAEVDAWLESRHG